MNKDFFTRNGKICPFGIDIAHTWDELGAILAIIYYFKIEAFVEFGVHKGGLSSFLAFHTYLNEDFKYLGIEKKLEDIDPRFLKMASFIHNVTFFHGSVFSRKCTELIRKFINISGKSLIYCDNGDKPMEFLVYSDIIKVGDLLMVHDYPREFNEDNSDFSLLDQIELEYLSETRIVLFERKND